MISRIRAQLGPAGFAIAVIALVAALAGGAYAASGSLTGKQKKEVEKISKKFAGAPGANGKDGTNGSNGKDGANGTNGKEGPAGAPGAPGAPGTPGKEGKAGKDGSPWTVGGTLPEGATETGAWTLTVSATLNEELGDENRGVAAISFPVPLAKADAEGIQVRYWKSTAPDPECPGNVREPEAKPGFLCIYGAITTGSGPEVFPPDRNLATGEKEIGTSGALLAYEGPEPGFYRYGSFAITAP